MAIDTAEKRRSVAGISFFILGPGVTPNVAKDQEWRQESAWSYSGILASAPVIPPSSTSPVGVPRWPLSLHLFESPGGGVDLHLPRPARLEPGG